MTVRLGRICLCDNDARHSAEISESTIEWP
jgi:hypothetical protein